MISIKSQGVTIHDVTILNAAKGKLSLRASKDCTVSACWLEGTKGIVVWGDHNRIVSNEIRGGDLAVFSGDATFDQYIHDKKDGKYRFQGAHPAAQHTILVDNRGSNGANILIGSKGRGKYEYYDINHFPALDTQVASDNQLSVKIDGKQKGTKKGLPFSDVKRFKARKLTPSDLTGATPTTILVNGTGATSIKDNLKANKKLGPKPFKWIAKVTPEEGIVEFLVDDKVVNRESSSPYGNRVTSKTPPSDFDGWNDPKSYTEGRHVLQVRHAESGAIKSTIVEMTHS